LWLNGTSYREEEREGEEEGKGEGEGKGKGRWKKDRLRNVGRTDARTHGRTDTKVILYSVQAMHSIALDRQKVNDYIYRALIAHAYRRRISKELRGRLFVNVAAIKLT